MKHPTIPTPTINDYFLQSTDDAMRGSQKLAQSNAGHSAIKSNATADGLAVAHSEKNSDKDIIMSKVSMISNQSAMGIAQPNIPTELVTKATIVDAKARMRKSVNGPNAGKAYMQVTLVFRGEGGEDYTVNFNLTTERAYWHMKSQFAHLGLIVPKDRQAFVNSLTKLIGLDVELKVIEEEGRQSVFITGVIDEDYDFSTFDPTWDKVMGPE